MNGFDAPRGSRFRGREWELLRYGTGCSPEELGFARSRGGAERPEPPAFSIAAKGFARENCEGGPTCVAPPRLRASARTEFFLLFPRNRESSDCSSGSR